MTAAAALPLPFVEHLRLLACEFTIRTNSAELFGGLGAIAQHAEQNMAVGSRETVEIIWNGGEFRIVGGGIDEDYELSAASTIDTLFKRLHRRAFAALPDHIRIRAASGVAREGYFLLVGTGKTTLAVQLMLEGRTMVGDELALLRGGEAVAFPRKFELREESLSLIPRLAAIERFAPIAANPQASRVVALDPREFGMPWRIAPAPVRAVFYLEPNYGGRSRLLPCGKVAIARRIMPQCAPPYSNRRGWLGDLCATLDRAETFIIELGDLDAAGAAIGVVLGDAAAPRSDIDQLGR